MIVAPYRSLGAVHVAVAWLFPIAEIVAYVSRFVELQPGDVISTGTPEGIGSRRTPPRFLVAGDVVEVEITGLGRLRNTVR